MCTDLTVPANAAIAYTGRSPDAGPGAPNGGSLNRRPVGIVATYSCTGSQFTLVGSITRACQSDRTWSPNSVPTCQSKLHLLTMFIVLFLFNYRILP